MAHTIKISLDLVFVC